MCFTSQDFGRDVNANDNANDNVYVNVNDNVYDNVNDNANDNANDNENDVVVVIKYNLIECNEIKLKYLRGTKLLKTHNVIFLPRGYAERVLAKGANGHGFIQRADRRNQRDQGRS